MISVSFLFLAQILEVMAASSMHEDTKQPGNEGKGQKRKNRFSQDKKIVERKQKSYVESLVQEMLEKAGTVAGKEMDWAKGFGKMRANKKWPFRFVESIEIQKHWDEQRNLAETLTARLRKHKAKAWNKEIKHTTPQDVILSSTSVYKRLKDQNASTQVKLKHYYTTFYRDSRCAPSNNETSPAAPISGNEYRTHRILVINPNNSPCSSWENQS